MWLLTAGPTREHLDDVRFLSNAASGRTGYAIAAEAARRGHEVVLVSGPVALAPPAGVDVHPVESAREMLDAARRVLETRGPDVLVGTAAVSDFRPAVRVAGKPPKERATFRLELCENPDVLAELTALGIARRSVGFALEDLGAGAAGLARAVRRARDKLVRKRLDAIVLNSTAAIDAASTRAWWVEAAGDPEPFGELAKPDLARALVDRILRETGTAARPG